MDNEQDGEAPGHQLAKQAPRSGPRTSTPSRPAASALELLPRGVGKVEVQAVNLYHEIKVGENVEHGRPGQERRHAQAQQYPGLLRPAAELAGRDPARPDRLPGAEQGAGRHHQVHPPADVSGRRLRAQDQDRVQRPTTAKSSPRTRSSASTSPPRRTSSASRSLVLLLVGLLVGIVVFGIKLTRR